MGIPIIVASVHTIDGSGNHRAPGNSSTKRTKLKAECATSVLRELLHHRERKRKAAAARASSQGQVQAPVPSIIMAGDLNINGKALEEEMCELYCDDIEWGR